MRQGKVEMGGNGGREEGYLACKKSRFGGSNAHSILFLGLICPHGSKWTCICDIAGTDLGRPTRPYPKKAST